MANRLARESSPYLLQHAHNPVDWFPWGDEAITRARAEDKPIFLSIGYSTCHWCHVMEHESFESLPVAEALNADFVPIKLDREERPDVDRVYMLFVQATTGAGGWPMSVWLTPELKPFYGGTYFPPTSRWGRPGFLDLLREIARLWREERPRILDSADDVLDRLRRLTSEAAAQATASDGPATSVKAIGQGISLFWQAFDRLHGGFGSSPKFPRPSELLFLLRAWAITHDDRARMMVLETLGAMARGGMYDHLGGGFHRYSVDAEWRVPHFEKMLYDQAQLVVALLEAAQADGEPELRSIAAETIDYVARDMTHAEGGFHSAEDADSIPPEEGSAAAPRKTEGAFYLWDSDEVERIVGQDADVVKPWFGIEASGNAPHDPQGEFGTKNILYLSRTPEQVAQQANVPVDDVMPIVDRAKRVLFDVRASRPRPHLDDKVITAWNGLMVAACARAARVLEGEVTKHGRDARSEYLMLAARAADFVKRHMWQPSRGVLLRRERGGNASIDGFAEDYASLIWGLLELFQTNGEVAWLDWALELQDIQDALFWDASGGGWFTTTGRDAAVLLRLKEDYDGAEPSAASVTTMNLIVLRHLTGNQRWMERIEQTLARLGPHAGEQARQAPLMLSNLVAWHAQGQQVVIVGDRESEDTRALRRVVASHYLPFAVHLPLEPGSALDALAVRLPWVRDFTLREGRPTAYVCRDFACERPVTKPEALETLLRAAQR